MYISRNTSITNECTNKNMTVKQKFAVGREGLKYSWWVKRKQQNFWCKCCGKNSTKQERR
jgi:hypothetical protein